MLVFACSCTSSPLGLTVNILFKDTPTCLYEYTSCMWKSKIRGKKRAHYKHKYGIFQVWCTIIKFSLTRTLLPSSTEKKVSLDVKLLNPFPPGASALILLELSSWVNRLPGPPAIWQPCRLCSDPVSKGGSSYWEVDTKRDHPER